MKQFIALVALVALASCGGSTTTTPTTTDSTSVKVDSVKTDSVKCDTTKHCDGVTGDAVLKKSTKK